MIPKKIHYIWLGGKSLPKIAEKCIESWGKFCPDYEIIRWDESNLNIDICKYCRDAYDSKKFAFSSDVLRFDILNKNGGIYLDIDVELIKTLDGFLDNKLFSGFEDENYVAPGLILGSIKNHPLLETMVSLYKSKEFNANNLFADTVCVNFTSILENSGLKKNNKTQSLRDGVKIYSTDYFCPMDYRNRKINITSKTHAIHHYAASWIKKPNIFKRISIKVKNLVKKIIGQKNTEKLRARKEYIQNKKQEKRTKK